ncbi:ABC transporter permease [Metabacillus fastidiosus]|uniref:ABC transporter permease n=1 Tax=Metabacillus fastidiosus TaxID=1458 RepID=UPI002DBC1AB3|nr:ABC transporter permease [Metabacillus fastidiosus]MEC2075782.1 ABC transporter permease [Metabacillus fastidiosus]
MNRSSSFFQFFIELFILFRIQVSIVRHQLIWILGMATMFPVVTLLFLEFILGNTSSEQLARLIIGNMIFSILLMGMNILGQDISYQKFGGYFTYYSSLPIRKVNFIMSLLFYGILTSLPSFIIIFLLGQKIYGIELHFEWLLIPVALISVFSVVGIGVLIGFLSPNPQFTNVVSQFSLMFITFMTPIMIDIDQLPVILKWISYILPTTYVANALQDMLTVGWTESVRNSVFILIIFSYISYFFISKKIHWRVQ